MATVSEAGPRVALSPHRVGVRTDKLIGKAIHNLGSSMQSSIAALV